MTDMWACLERERLELADFFETLTPQEWEVQSLCSEWTVREVAAHLCAIGQLRRRRWSLGLAIPSAMLTSRMAKAGFRLDRYAAQHGKEFGAEPPEVIIARLRELATWQEHPPGMPKVAPLGDILVHNLDIRRPLGKPRPTPGDSFAFAAPMLTKIGFLSVYFGSRKRIDGLRIIADDLDWSTGDGPEVHGSAEAILLMLANRPIGRNELTGEGAELLYARLPLRAD